MRNFYYLVFSFLISTFAFGQWSEGFESGIPADWTVVNQGGSNTWIAGVPNDEGGNPVEAHEGSQCAKINFSFSGGHDDYLITPQIAVTVGVNGFLSLYAKNGSSTFTDLFDVKVSTSGTAPEDFTDVIASNITPPDTWTNYQFNLNAYAGQNIYVAIRAGSQSANQELDIDLVESFAGPNCPDIANISITENTGDTVTLTWENGAEETMWDIEYGLSGFTPTGVPTIDDVSTNPYTVTGLTSDVTYDFYIRADCGGTDISEWVGPFTVTTIINYCAGAQFTDTGGASANYSNNENENWLIAPVTTGERVRVVFTAFDTQNNSDFLRVYNGPDNTYPVLHPGNGFTGATGTQTTVPGTLISTDPSGALYFEFTSNGFTTGEGWVANVTCEPIPTCLDITNLSADQITGESAVLSWTAPAEQFSWSIEYGPTGFTLGSGTVISNITEATYVLNNLNPITEYDFYVQGECPNSDFSVWAGPSTFETACATVTPEYSEDFSSYLPSCWEEASNGTMPEGPSDLGTNGSWLEDGWANNGTTGAAKINLWATGKNDWIVSPVIDLGDGSTIYELKYDVATYQFGSSSTLAGFSNDDELQVIIYNGGVWTLLESFTSENTPVLQTGRVISLSGYTGPSRIAFYGTEGTINDSSDIDVFIDNVIVRVQPACPDVTQLLADQITGDSAVLNWTAPDSQSSWSIEYGPSGFTLGSGTLVENITETTYTLTDLNPVTTYDFYVQGTCSDTEFSEWVGPISFQTECAMVTPEYTEDFTDYLPNCWEEASNGTMPDGPSDLGTNGAWLEDGWTNIGITGAAKINLYAIGKDDWLVSPTIDLGDGSTYYELKYDVATYHWGSSTNLEGFSDDDELQVIIYSGGVWTLLESFTSANTPVEEIDRIVPLTGFTGPSRIAFYGTEGTINDSSDVDAFIDNVVVREQPTCPQPGFVEIDATTDTAEITWSGSDNTVEYIVVYVEAGGDPEVDGIQVSPNPTSSNTTLTGLTHSTAYDVYITADCGLEDGQSVTAGPFGFQTDLPNDECETSVELTSSPLGESCTTLVSGSITGATNSGIAGCTGTADDDVWYHFEAISNRQKITISNVVGSTSDLNFEVFEGACGSLTSLFCSDPLIGTVLDLNMGETYYIRVFSAESTAQEVTFDICITALMPEAENSSCTTAIAVDANTDLPYSNSQYNYVTASGEGGFIEGCAGGSNDGVWYSLLGNGNEVIIDVQPTHGYNAEVGIYSSPCGETPPVVEACSSNAGTDGLESITFTTEADTMYYINVGHYSSVADFPEGDFDIDIYVDTTDVEDIQNQLSSHLLYPNPTSGTLTYSGEESIKSVVVYGLDGRIVNTRIAIDNDHSFDVSHLEKGIYFINIRLEDGSTESFKIIKE